MLASLCFANTRFAHVKALTDKLMASLTVHKDRQQAQTRSRTRRTQRHKRNRSKGKLTLSSRVQFTITS